MMQNKTWVSLAGLTFLYSLALAAIMQAAQTLTRVALSFVLAVSSAAVLNPITIFGELANKVTWSVLACEAVVLFSILARRRELVLILASVVSIFVGVLLGQYLRVIVENLVGRASAFIWQAALDSSALMSSKYVLVGAAVAWANRLAESTLRHYLAAGLIAAVGASAITLIALNADLIAKLGTIAIDFVFPLGCSVVVWKVRQMAKPLIAAQRETRTQLKNI